ncbi:MAG: hypothetical protein ACETWT_10890 [Thermodesulfobacteriota bacterium]
MSHYFKCTVVSLTMILTICISTLGLVYAEEKRQMGGWEKDSPYNKLFNPNEVDSFKGVVVGFQEVTPLPGMSPGVALLVRERGGNDVITVHLGPTWFIKQVGVKKGEQVKVKGVWAEIEGKDVFMACKVKKGDYFEFKVRLTKDGRPFWTMSPEELAKERASE